MATATVEGLRGIKTKVTARANSVGGVDPDPPIHDFPLLAWSPTHPVHGDVVFTEDQRASVHDVAIACAEMPSFAAVAAKFGTTEEHVSQAFHYAFKAGFIRGA